MLSTKTIEIVKSTAPVLAEKGLEITSHFYKRLFENHPELLNIFNHANQKQGRQQTALANTIYAAATYIDQLEVLLPAVKQIAYKHRSLGVKPEHYPIVGEHLLLAIKEVLGEVASDEIIQAWGAAYGVISQVFIDVENEMYAEAKNQPYGWEGFKKFVVVKKQQENNLITSLYLEPMDKTAVPSFQPGQYITIRLNIPGETYLVNRQYSLSNAPGEKYYRISVKREANNSTPNGKVSNYLHDLLVMGNELDVSAPSGDFYLNEESSAPIYLISGGIGVTPMMSMLNYLKEKQPSREITFIHAAQNGDVHAFKEEKAKLFSELENAHQSLFYNQPTEEDKKHDGFIEGRIQMDWIKTNIRNKNAHFYICGPIPFMRAMIDSLERIGVYDENIHYEFFGPSINLKEYQNV
ncbi:NO-inducible flavohemoprotein [Metabacillus herbersteinensis]|uniref:Flavohemoprotein n=1 Tax=Metabacillus herbersteinensis TaxID=283816 RepID=A0ABV6GFC0_9BACI